METVKAKTTRPVLAAFIAALCVAACAGPSSTAPQAESTSPAVAQWNTPQSPPVQLSTACNEALAAPRQFMANNAAVVLDNNVSESLRALIEPAYEVCTQSELRSFDERELMVWVAALPGQ